MRTAVSVSPPALLPVGLVAARNFDSFEEMATWAPAWTWELRQLGEGLFRGRQLVAYTSRVKLAVVVRRPGVVSRGIPPPGTRVVGVCLATGPILVKGRPLRRGEVAVLGGGAPFEFRVTGPQMAFLAAVDEQLFASHAATRARPHAFDEDGWLRLRDREAERGMLRAWYGEIRRALREPGALADPGAAARFEHAVLDALLDATAETGRPVRSPEWRVLTKRAEAYLDACLHDQITLSELSRAVGAPVRTLDDGFRQSLGFSPEAYGKVLRLNAARVDLRKSQPGATVSRVAVRWGFFHLGSFSVDYRRMFGEGPSETLRPG
jgi:AraC-like DNA-binding protein